MADRLVNDARIDPRIRALFAAEGNALGLDPNMMRDIGVFSSREELLLKRGGMIKEMIKKMASAPKPAPPSPQVRALWSNTGLEDSPKTITSAPDGNTLGINFVRPSGGGVVPLVVYFHGGGMAVGSAFDPQYKIMAKLIARNGVAVAMVDFRNCEVPSLSNQDVAPFPAGMNDCYSGLLWCHEHAAELGIDRSRVCIAGESGGGNLTIAVALKCKKEGRLDLMPSGFFSMCPYIAGIWPQDEEESKQYSILGTSHIENNGIFISVPGNTNAAMGYGIDAFKRKDPLAWPGFATVDDLQGLPRCVISVNECDPLRDEGINFYRRLLAAGVSARCVDLIGTPHGGDMMITACPDIVLETARSIADFACGDNLRARSPLPPAESKL